MKIAVEGCCHGELDKIYETIAYIETQDNIKVELLLICGDFQAVRNESDLKAMAVPTKYQKINTFYKYYSGEKKAPVLTIFIGGNHESSNYLQELPYGGWVAPNIYYLGYAGVVRYGGLRIAGLSGIYKGRDYSRGHFEHPPYNEDTKRSCYHIRNIDVFRLKQIRQPLDICLSHDWPRGIYHFGDVDGLLRRKSFFSQEIASGTLGSPPAEELLYHLKPDYWFSAHLHVKFAAIVQHEMENGSSKQTKFLALDKCLPKRQFLQILDVEPREGSQASDQLELDPEWLCILRSTSHLLRLTKAPCYMPGPGAAERYDFSVTEAELVSLNADFGGIYRVPENFEVTLPPYNPQTPNRHAPPPQININAQTTLLCQMIGISDPFAIFSGRQPSDGVLGDVADDADTNDSLDVDDRDEGILDDSDYVNSTMESSSLTAANSTFNPDEISLEDLDDDDDIQIGDVPVADSSEEPPSKRQSLSPLTSTSASETEQLTDNVEDISTDVAKPPSADPEPSASSSSESPTVRTPGVLKRRNLAIYSAADSSSEDVD